MCVCASARQGWVVVVDGNGNVERKITGVAIDQRERDGATTTTQKKNQPFISPSLRAKPHSFILDRFPMLPNLQIF